MRILSMSGFIPEHICDTLRFTEYKGDLNISNYCSYAEDYISKVVQDEDIDGAVFPKSCDSTRIISSYLSGLGKFTYQINVPPYNTHASIDYFTEEIKRYKQAVEDYYGVAISQEDVFQRVLQINQRNRSIQGLYDALNDISYKAYLTMIHELLCKPLKEQVTINELGNSQGDKSVYLIGSFLPDLKLLDEVARAGLRIVGDNLPESGRLVSRKAVSTEGDIYRNISESILSTKPSPSQSGFKAILDADIEEMKRKGVLGAIFVTQQYCEPYDYYYSIAREMFEAKGISVLQIKLNGTHDVTVARLSLEAFYDTL